MSNEPPEVGRTAHASQPSLRSSTVSTLVVMVSTFVSRLLGFLRIAVIGAVFGASGNADVLNLVFNIPNNLRKLLAEGALSSAFIPVLSREIVRDPAGAKPQLVVRNILALQFVILVPLLILSVVFANPIINTILDFPEPERQALAADLFQYLINYLLLISISAVLVGTLNAHNRFLVPAVTPLFFSIAVIVSILTLHRQLGVFSMAVGVLVGGVLQVAFQAPLFLRLGYGFRLSFRFDSPEFRQIMRQWLPVVATASIFTINQQVSLFFASGLEDGSGSAMTNALTFWQLPFGIFSASITTVLFPRMSREHAQDDIDGLRRSVEYGLRYLFALLIPAALVLGLLGREIIAVALQRGAFEVQYTQLAARVLGGFSIGLFSVAAFTFLQRFFYACGDYKTPLRVAIITLVVDVALALWLKETWLRVVGLSIANSAAFTLGALLLFRGAYRDLNGMALRAFAVTVLKVSVTGIPLTAFILAFLAYSGDWWVHGSTLGNLARLAAVGFPSVLIVVLMYILLRVEFVRTIVSRRRKP